MTDADDPSPEPTSRRRALAGMGAAVAGGVMAAARAGAQPGAAAVVRPAVPPPGRVPRAELVSLFQYEEQARLALGGARLRPVSGGDRTVTDRITLRPRVCIPTRDMDLTSTLFGDRHFAPIIIGPMADQKRFHPDAERATAQGASAAKAGMVISSATSLPLAEIARAATTPVWLQVDPRNPKFPDMLAAARNAKVSAVVVTVVVGSRAGTRLDWTGVDAVVRATSLPVIVKGVTRPQEAVEAVARGAQGVIVSNYRGIDDPALPGPLLLIEPVVQAVGGRVPVLVDGSFRYGSDVLKALGFGAKAVLIGRPAMWGLAAYGADGVQGVAELLQSDLARFMGMCGRPTLASVDRSVVRVHAPSGGRRAA